MDQPPSWRDRVVAEDVLQHDLRQQLSKSARRRAQALLDGCQELGGPTAVAKELGLTHWAVAKAIRTHLGTTP